MLSSIGRIVALSAVTTAFIACEAPTQIDVSTEGQVIQAVSNLGVIPPAPDTEGEEVSIAINTMCTPNSGGTVDVVITWGDDRGNGTPCDQPGLVDAVNCAGTATQSCGGNSYCVDARQLTANTVDSATSGGLCNVGTDFEVCSPTGFRDPGCDGITHTFIDDSGAATTFPIQVTANDGSAQQVFPVQADIDNVAPTVSLTLTNLASEGDTVDLEIDVTDPGENAVQDEDTNPFVTPAAFVTEIQQVVFDFAPADKVLLADDERARDPEQIICDCDNAGENILQALDDPHCAAGGPDRLVFDGAVNVTTNGFDLDLCGAHGGDTVTDFFEQFTYLQNTNFGVDFVDVTVTVTDRQGGVGSDSVAVSVVDQAPNGLAMRVDDDADTSAPFALEADNLLPPTNLIEGTLYSVFADYADDGTDQHNIEINYGDGPNLVDPSDDVTVDGTGAITKDTYPGFDCTTLGGTIDACDAIEDVPQVLRQRSSNGDGFRWDDQAAGDLERAVTFFVQDRANSVSLTEDFHILINDVTPSVSLTAQSGVGAPQTTPLTVDEGSDVVYTATSANGVQDNVGGFDDLRLLTWNCVGGICGTGVTLNGNVGDEPVANRLRIISGCSGTPTNLTTSTDTCVLRTLDGDDVDEIPLAVATTFTVSVTVHDEDNNATSNSIDMTVDDVDPVIVIQTVTSPVDEVHFDAAGAVTTNSTLTMVIDDPAGPLDGPYSISVDWGDSSTDDLISPLNSGVNEQASISHAFQNNLDCLIAGQTPQGSCTVTAVAADNASSSDTEQATVLVDNVAPTASVDSPAVPVGLINGITYAGETTLVEGIPFTLSASWTDPAGITDRFNDDQYLFNWSFANNPALQGTFDVNDVLPGEAGFPYNSANPLIAATAAQLDAATVNIVTETGRNDVLELNLQDESGNSGDDDDDSVNIAIRDNNPLICDGLDGRPVGTVGEAVRVQFAEITAGVTIQSTEEGSALGEIILDMRAETSADLITQVDVDWGDGTTDSEGVAAKGVFPLGPNCTVFSLRKSSPYMDNCETSGQLCDANGDYIVTITITDEDSSIVRSGALEVINVDPERVAFNPDPGVPPGFIPQIVSEGESPSYVIEFNDVSVFTNFNNPPNPPVLQTPGDATTLVFDVDWGDGTFDDGDAVGSSTAGGNASIGRLNHNYSAPGQYFVQVVARDKDASGNAQDTDPVAPGDQTVFDPQLPGIEPTPPANIPNDGYSIVVVAIIEVVNVPPVITDVANTGPIVESQNISIISLTENPGQDVLTYAFNFDCQDEIDAAVAEDLRFPAADPDVIVNQVSAVAGRDYPQDGSFTACVEVCDDEGDCDYGTTSFLVENSAPDVVLTAPAVAFESDSALVPISAAVSDLGVLDTQTVTLNCGVGGNINGTATNCIYGDNGTVAVTASSNDGVDTTTVAQPITIVNVPPATPSVTVASTTIDETTLASVNVDSSDVAADIGSLTIIINWGDGTTDVVGSDANGDALAVTHSYNQPGAFVITATASDKDGGVSGVGTTAGAPAVPSVTVNNVVPVITAVTAPTVDEGNATTISVTANDGADGDAIVAFLFDFDGDNTFEVTSASNTITRTFPVGTSAPFNVRVRDSDGGESATFGGTTATVNNVAPSAPSLTGSTPVTVGSAATFTATATDPGNGPLTFNYTFGDGTTANGQPGTAAHTYGSAGTFNVTATATDAQGLTGPVSAVFVVTVTDVNVLVNISANPSQISEGDTSDILVIPTTGTQPFTLDFSYTVAGQNLTDQVTGCDPANVASCTATLSFPNNNVGDAPVSVSVQVTDSAASVAAAAVNVTVSNVAPGIAIAPATVNGTELAASTITVTCTDVAGDNAAPAFVGGSNSIPTFVGAVATWTPSFSDAPGGADALTFSCTDVDGAVSESTVDTNIGVIDNNGNSISDTLETLVLGAPLGAGVPVPDSDGDGVDDIQEFLDGTDPDVPNSPSAPVVIEPADGDRVSGTEVTVTIANSDNPRGLPLTYTFELKDSDGNVLDTVTVDEAGGSTTTTELDISGADEDETLTWTVTVDDGVGTPTVSEPSSFVVDNVNGGPPAPSNIAPIDASPFSFETIVTLEASAVVDPDGDDVSYVFEVSTDSSFATVDVTSPARAVPFFTPGLLAPGTHHWRVTASDGVNDATSTSTNFVIEEEEILVNFAPTVPGIVSPADETLDSTSATLTITASTDVEGDAIQYEFEIADNPAFAGATLSGAQDGLTFDVTDLDENAVFFWRARATDGTNASDFATATFAVNAENEPPAGLAILSPTSGAILDVLAAPESFLVQSAIDPDGDELTYTFTLATDEAFADVILSETADAGEGTTEWVPQGAFALEEGETFLKVEVSDGTNAIDVTGSFTLFSTEIVVPDPGCGCDASGEGRSSSALGGGFALLAIGALLRRRRRRDTVA